MEQLWAILKNNSVATYSMKFHQQFEFILDIISEVPKMQLSCFDGYEKLEEIASTLMNKS